MTLLLSYLVIVGGQVQREDELRPTPDMNAPFKVYVPVDLEDSFVELKKMLSPAVVEKMKLGTEEGMNGYHLSLGMWLRNNWALWKQGRLAKYFHTLRIYHPEDMSGIALTSFYRHLNGKPIELDAQVKTCRSWWGGHAIGDFFWCPWDDSKVFVRAALPGTLIDGVPARIAVGRCKAKGHLWAEMYEKRPWRPIGDELTQIRKLESVAKKPWH